MLKPRVPIPAMNTIVAMDTAAITISAIAIVIAAVIALRASRQE
jgi:hypothetical protein